MTYAIRMPDGRLITDPEWHTPADVMRAAHGHGVARMPGDLVRMPERIQRRRTAGWRMPEDAVYVGRLPNGLGGWGNPFIVSEHQTRQQAVDNFRRALLDGRLQFSVARVRRELAGRDLACWCPLSAPCHADVLLEVANS